MEITNREVIGFYKDNINASCRWTDKFLSDPQNVQKSGGYIDISETFLNIGKPDEKHKHCEDRAYYKWLERQRSKGFTGTEHLIGTDMDIFLEKGMTSRTQAWHLFISYYTYKVFRASADYLDEELWPEDCRPCCPNHNVSEDVQDAQATDRIKGILKDGNYVITCPELRLWMLEAAGVETESEKYYDLAINYRNGQTTVSEWKKHCDEMNALILKKIMHSLGG